MPKTRSLLGVALLAAALGLALVWLVLATRSSATERPDPVRREVAPARVNQPTQGVELASPSSSEPQLESAGESARATVAQAPASAVTETFDLATAQWVDGILRLPAGEPDDEQLELYAFSTTEDEPAFAEECDAFDVRELRRNLRGQPYPAARVSLNPDGSFRAPFAAGAAGGCLRLCARYAYLPEPFYLTLPASRATLEPKLGAYFTGRFTLPARLPADFVAAELTFDVAITGWRSGFGRGRRANLRCPVDESLAFEFGGLVPELSYYLHADPVWFVAVTDTTVQLQPGAHVERDFALLAGASVAGQVLDQRGRPLAGASVDYESDSDRVWGPRTSRSTTTGDDGSYLLRAVPAGSCMIAAKLEGHSEGKSEAFTLADGDARTGVVLRLADGTGVAGRVVWPDGRAAVGASVTVVEAVVTARGSARWQRDEDHSTLTDAHGAFGVSGLGEGPFEVRAELRERSATEAASGTSEGTADDEGRLWRARLAEIAPGTDVVLTLSPPVEVSGRVVDDLGHAVPRFSIAASEILDSQDGATRNFKTREFEDAEGDFTYSNLSARQWQLSAQAAGHGNSEEVRVDLSARDAAPLVFVVPRAAKVAGIVRDPQGAPARAATVQVRRSGEQRWNPDRTEVTSDGEGRFVFEALPPGAVELSASAEALAPSPRVALALEPGASIVDVELALSMGGRLTGEIYTATGVADAGRNIQVQDVRGSGGGQARADAAGHFEVEHLAPGTYQVIAIPDPETLQRNADPGAVLSQLKMASAEIKEGETTHVVLGAPPAAPVRLHGRVTAGGEPVVGGLVMATAEGGSVLNSMKMDSTDERGFYEVVLDAPGNYTLMASPESDFGDGSELHVRVPEAEELALDIALPLGALSGRVVAPDGSPAVGVSLTLEVEDRVSLLSLSGGRGATSDTDGRFAFKSLRAGRYTLRTRASRFGQTVAREARFGTAVLSGLVVREDGRSDEVELRLSEPCSITGIVRDRSGEPVARADIFVRDAEGRVLNPLSSCASDAAGRFTFSEASPGSYTVCARVANQASAESAPVRVAPGAKTDVELTLEPGTMLRVVVEGPDERPVPARISVLDERGREVAGILETAGMERLFTEGFSSTEQRIGPLPPGKYRVTATTDDGASTTKPVSLSGQDERKLIVRLKE